MVPQLQPLLAHVHRSHHQVVDHRAKRHRGPRSQGSLTRWYWHGDDGGGGGGAAAAHLRGGRGARCARQPLPEHWLARLVDREVGAVGGDATREHGLHAAPHPSHALLLGHLGKGGQDAPLVRRHRRSIQAHTCRRVPYLHDRLHRVNRKHEGVLGHPGDGASHDVLRSTLRASVRALMAGARGHGLGGAGVGRQTCAQVLLCSSHSSTSNSLARRSNLLSELSEAIAKCRRLRASSTVSCLVRVATTA